MTITVKIDAIVSRMRKHTVQNYMNAFFLCRSAEFFKYFLISEFRRDFFVVGSVVFVVAGGQEDGVA